MEHNTFTRNPQWIPQSQHPTVAGWYYTRQEGAVSARYFDDSDKSWWLCSEGEMTPNNSFRVWYSIPGVSDIQGHRRSPQVAGGSIEYNIKRDGNQWCATTSMFVNLQESPAGFGNSPSRALEELFKALTAAGRMW